MPTKRTLTAPARPVSSPEASADLHWLVPLALVLCAVAGTAAIFHQPLDYVARMAPSWFVPAGAVTALVTLGAGRSDGQRNAGLLIATLLLMPAGGALMLFHALRALGAIPMPVDMGSALVSLIAAAALVTLWTAPSPLRPAKDVRSEVPRWVAWAGILSSLVYPALKVSWALGSAWLAPAGAVGIVDTTFFASTGVALLAVVPLLVALRWFDGPAPGWARPAALVGGMVLTSLGASGLWTTWTDFSSGALHLAGGYSGLAVYGGWLLWGLCTTAVSRRLTTQTTEEKMPPTRFGGSQ